MGLGIGRADRGLRPVEVRYGLRVAGDVHPERRHGRLRAVMGESGPGTEGLGDVEAPHGLALGDASGLRSLDELRSATRLESHVRAVAIEVLAFSGEAD